MTRHPDHLAIFKQASATPPPIPVISTVSPCRSCARLWSIRQAVRCVSPYAAASTAEMCSGIASTLVAGAHNISAWAPGPCSPIIQMFLPAGAELGFGGSFNSKAALSTTRQPTQASSTPLPTALTRPQQSDPPICGHIVSTPGSPRAVHRSR